MIKPLLVITFLSVALSSCTSPCGDIKHEQSIKELQIKLNATEAQLLNVRAELSRCNGDSIMPLKDSIR
jgi:hypothetical protein